MSIINASPLLGAGADGYQIERSLRFNSADSAYLNRTPASAGNRKTWTWSAWVKRTNVGNSQTLFAARTGVGATYLVVSFDQAGDFRLASDSETSYPLFKTNALFRDPSAWYHVVVALNMTQATSTNRLKVYVNGIEQTTASYNVPAQNTDLAVNSTETHLIGQQASGSYLDGYLTEVHFIDGQALTPSSFGETDTITGVWKPKRYAGTYGTNGFYLKFADNSGTTSTTLGKDSSGNSNNWTPNNFSVTAGAGNDSMIDTPTPYADGGNGRGNYATLNPLDANGGNFFNGNLEYAGPYSSFSTQNGHGCRSTLRVRPTGKWYVEAAAVTYSGIGNSTMLGFTSSTQEFTATAFGSTLTPWLGVDASINNSTIRLNWNGVSGGTASATLLFGTYASGDVVNFAIDFDAGKFWVGKNGTWYNSGNPAAGTNATTTFTAGSSDWAFWGEYIASSDNSNRSSVVANFGQRAFAYTPPSGFLALNTQNLPEPSIKKPSSYMDTLLYTGNATVRSITGLGFSPEFVWIKSRSAANDHKLYDAVRGTTKVLESSNTGAEGTDSGGLTAFNSDGFSLGTAAGQNQNGTTYVAWCWDESATPGFDIVTYTGNGTARTIAHSLGVAPSMMVIKRRDAAEDWGVYHVSLGNTQYLYLDSTQAAATSANVWNNTSPTSSVFSVAGSTVVNANTGTYVAYLWSEVAGFSKFGSYTGNGSTDGPFVFCGFRPKFVMFKCSSSSESGNADWHIQDSSRNASNISTGSNRLFANLSAAESSNAEYKTDFLSNGFKLRTDGVNYGQNNNGNTYIFAAFAESPQKYSLAR